MQIVVSAVVGGLVAFFGTGPAFLVNAASFVISTLFITRLHVPLHVGQLERSTKQGVGAYLRDAKQGLGFAVHDRFVSRLLLVQMLAPFLLPPQGRCWWCSRSDIYACLPLDSPG